MQDTMMSEQAQKAMLARMRRIEGQARGVQRMISEERDCLEILNQLASLRSAAYNASVELTEQYAIKVCARCCRRWLHRRKAGRRGNARPGGSIVEDASLSTPTKSRARPCGRAFSCKELAFPKGER